MISKVRMFYDALSTDFSTVGVENVSNSWREGKHQPWINADNADLKFCFSDGTANKSCDVI
ncbi:MAG TPA: hypothetical protein VGJ66_03285 [Pyrinomonadaceae bacterium]|jgi:hypothetical protein